MNKKLLSIQKEIGVIIKDQTNPFYKSKYADINALLEVIKPILNKHGVVLLQPLTNINGAAAIKTILIDSETDAKIEDITPLTQNPDPQKMGSAITYFRRYSLQSLLGLQAADDDGNNALRNVTAKIKADIEKISTIIKLQEYYTKNKDKHSDNSNKFNKIISDRKTKIEKDNENH